MVANLATKEEFTVGWGFPPNKENAVALKKSGGCESLTDKNTAITPLTTAPYGAETLVLSGFQGGGGATRKTRSTSAFRGTRDENNSCMSSRSSFDAIYHSRRLAGSQTKIRHKLKDLCENI